MVECVQHHCPGRLFTAHQFNHDINVRILNDSIRIHCNFCIYSQLPVFAKVTHENFRYFDCCSGPLPDQRCIILQYTYHSGSHRAEAQQTDVHHPVHIIPFFPSIRPVPRLPAASLPRSPGFYPARLRDRSTAPPFRSTTWRWPLPAGEFPD